MIFTINFQLKVQKKFLDTLQYEYLLLPTKYSSKNVFHTIVHLNDLNANGCIYTYFVQANMVISHVKPAGSFFKKVTVTIFPVINT